MPKYIPPSPSPSPSYPASHLLSERRAHARGSTNENCDSDSTRIRILGPGGRVVPAILVHCFVVAVIAVVVVVVVVVVGVDIDIGFGEYLVDDGAEVGSARMNPVRRSDGRERGGGVARLEF